MPIVLLEVVAIASIVAGVALGVSVPAALVIFGVFVLAVTRKASR